MHCKTLVVDVERNADSFHLDKETISVATTLLRLDFNNGGVCVGRIKSWSHAMSR